MLSFCNTFHILANGKIILLRYFVGKTPLMIGTLTSSSPINPTPISNFWILEPSTSIEIINDKRLLKELLHGVKCLAYSLKYAHSYNQTIGKFIGSYDALANKEEVEAKVW